MPITPFPPAPSRADPANFADEADAYLNHLESPFVGEANALEANVNAKEATATASATAAAASATAAANTANVSEWVSGTTYAVGVNRYDTTDFLTYRRKTAGAGTTRPGLDSTNWQLLTGLGNVSLDGVQALTNKTISVDNNMIIGVAASSFVLSSEIGNIDGTAAQKSIPVGDVVGTNDNQALTNKTLSGVVLNEGYTEEVFAVTGTTPALSPNNGSIQTWTLTANSTPTAGTWNAGQSITLMIDDGSAATVTWTSLAVAWKTDGGSAPMLNTTGFTAIALWKVGTTIYGARVGDA